ncbi:hypothetical protein SCLCIDRAFT_287706 [Scleroderma citrinum Foug A]|uniref:Uncharacterized protein n=1 Tax=Scleroderma citrinum Foug A TaxID=1036808 RepID=A0A0C2Z1Q9_9AGAM|nr:hypothetical protein SCLCIDRAFT_287706 [Scleroderma citrinum Foug A]
MASVQFPTLFTSPACQCMPLRLVSPPPSFGSIDAISSASDSFWVSMRSIPRSGCSQMGIVRWSAQHWDAPVIIE